MNPHQANPIHLNTFILSICEIYIHPTKLSKKLFRLFFFLLFVSGKKKIALKINTRNIFNRFDWRNFFHQILEN